MTNTSKWKFTFTIGKTKPTPTAQETNVVVEQVSPTKPENPHDPSTAGILFAMLFLLGGIVWWKRTTIAKFIQN